MKYEYEVLEERNAWELASKVNKKMIEGWRPLGGVSVAITENKNYGTSYCQAMMRIDRAESPNPPEENHG